MVPLVLPLMAMLVPKVGVVANTILPLPVTVFPNAVIVPEVGNVNAVVPVAVNVTLYAPLVANVLLFARVRVPVVVLTVKPLILVAVATPNVGVVKLGLVASTTLPLPVELVNIGACAAEPVPVLV